MPTSDQVRDFYRLRASGDVDKLRSVIAEDVVWREPSVGNHMGELLGVEAVIDMITRALDTTAGTFSLRVAECVEIAGHCAAIIEWTAEKDGKLIEGREMAIYSITDGKITFAQFLPENIDNDQAFWAGN